jgi:hypothetical protein
MTILVCSIVIYFYFVMLHNCLAYLKVSADNGQLFVRQYQVGVIVINLIANQCVDMSMGIYYRPFQAEKDYV